MDESSDEDLFLAGVSTPSSDIRRFKAIPKLRGEENWFTWRMDFESVLKDQHPTFMGILRGEITAPTKFTYRPATWDEARIKLYQDNMSQTEFASFKASNFDTSSISAQHISPTVGAIRSEMASIDEANKKVRETNCKERSLFSSYAARIWTYLSMCVDRVARTEIGRYTDPHLAFERLRAIYGHPSPLGGVFRFKDWTELRYAGDNPHEYARRFQRAKIEWEGCVDEPIGFVIEYCVFLTSVFDNPQCANFVQNFQACTSEAMYSDFIAAMTAQQSLQRAQHRGATTRAPNLKPTGSKHQKKRAQFRKESPNFQPPKKPGWQWCPFHQRWVMHAPDSCRLNPAHDAPNVGAANAVKMTSANPRNMAKTHESQHAKDLIPSQSGPTMNRMEPLQNNTIYFPDSAF